MKKKEPPLWADCKQSEPPQTWETFEQYLLGQGLVRYMRALENTDEATYLKVFPTLLEFIKPKIKRVESLDRSGDEIRVVVVRDENTTPSSFNTDKHSNLDKHSNKSYE
jgi:hypothetical protein